jgi:serine/threonine protein kinase
MSPEQVRGKSIDARSDIFSLGATFFEMLTGRRAFARETPVETLGAVLRDDPKQHPEAQKIPEPLKAFVFRSLEKDAADRYQSARDLMLDLRAYQAERMSRAAERVSFRSEPPWKHRRTRVVIRAIGGVALLVAGFWAGSCWQRDRVAPSGGPARAQSQP